MKIDRELYFHWGGVSIRAMCILAVLSVTAESIAEPGPIGRWLMTTPMSLWDKGMFEVGNTVKRATEHIASGYDARGGVNYDWDNNEINIWLSVHNYPNDLSHENCNKIRRTFIGHIASAKGEDDDNIAALLLYASIASWFSHIGYKTPHPGPSKNLGAPMSRIIFVKTELSTKGETISCRDRIMEFHAPSKPGL